MLMYQKPIDPSYPHEISGRFVVFSFYASLVFFTGGISWMAIQYANRKVQKRYERIPLVRCIEIIDGKSIKVHREGELYIVRFLGIESPADHPQRITPGLIPLREEQIAKRALQAWLYQKPVRLTFPEDNPQRDAEGRLLSYVDIYGVDVAKKLLQEGQALASTTGSHPRLERYKQFESEARKARKGIWRPP